MAKKSKPNSLNDIWTGENDSNPAIVKAKDDKLKSNSVATAYARKVAAEKAAAIAKAISKAKKR